MVTLMYVIFVFLLSAAAILVAWDERKRLADFEERFPPISDEGFVARCSPGTDPAVALKVRRVLAESLCVEYERIHPSARLMQDLGAE
jgi:hypothetical protein